MEQQVKETFVEHKGRYGARRIMHALSKGGLKVSRYQAATVLRKLGLKAIQPKSYVPKTTDSRHSYAVSPNLLASTWWPQQVNQVWVCDITYVPLKNNDWCYLAVIMDLVSRKIIGWQLADNMKEQLVIDALRKALRNRKKLYNLIIHSDRGGQYASNLYRAILRRYEIDQSMSEADNPYDNAFMESCFSRMKAELMQDKSYETIESARVEIFEYIEEYYNRKRLHSSIEYNSPETYEQLLQKQLPLKSTNNRRYIIPKKDFSERGVDPLPLKHKQNSSSLPKEMGDIN
jgi:putative transposase